MHEGESRIMKTEFNESEKYGVCSPQCLQITQCLQVVILKNSLALLFLYVIGLHIN